LNGRNNPGPPGRPQTARPGPARRPPFYGHRPFATRACPRMLKASAAATHGRIPPGTASPLSVTPRYARATCRSRGLDFPPRNSPKYAFRPPPSLVSRVSQRRSRFRERVDTASHDLALGSCLGYHRSPGGQVGGEEHGRGLRCSMSSGGSTVRWLTGPGIRGPLRGPTR